MKKQIWHKENARKIPKYLHYLHNSGQKCLVCGSNCIELHHVKTKHNRLKDDSHIIPLCPDHHRGPEFSAHDTPAAFRARYSDEHLLQVAAVLFAEYEKYDIICQK